MSYAAAARAGQRIQRDLLRAVNARVLSANTVKFHYQNQTSGTFSRYSERNMTAVFEDLWIEFPAFTHFVQPVETGLRRHMEVEVGDCIVDVIEGTLGVDSAGTTDVPLVFDGLARPRFEIDGKFFTQKAIGKDLGQYWDVKMDDNRITRTFLLGFMTGDNT